MRRSRWFTWAGEARNPALGAETWCTGPTRLFEWLIAVPTNGNEGTAKSEAPHQVMEELDVLEDILPGSAADRVDLAPDALALDQPDGKALSPTATQSGGTSHADGCGSATCQPIEAREPWRRLLPPAEDSRSPSVAPAQAL